jgi:hypothetical protein
MGLLATRNLFHDRVPFAVTLTGIEARQIGQFIKAACLHDHIWSTKV